jgi:dTDP-4-dehydrorhamnose 3,5-epimerase
MHFTATPLAIPDVKLIGRRQFRDSRGYFMVTYEVSEFRHLGLPEFVQDNQAQSVRRGTIRGLHFQRPPHAQAKLVWALRGAIFDVAVDIRAGSPTFGNWVGATLRAGSGEALFVPRGFAHGYCTLEDDTEVAYKCDAVYAPLADGGVLYSDPAIGIAWPVVPDAAIVSEKDGGLPLLKDLETPSVQEVAG